MHSSSFEDLQRHRRVKQDLRADGGCAAREERHVDDK